MKDLFLGLFQLSVASCTPCLVSPSIFKTCHVASLSQKFLSVLFIAVFPAPRIVSDKHVIQISACHTTFSSSFLRSPSVSLL